MYRGSRPRILPILIVIVVVVALIAALVTVGRLIFGGGSSTQSTQSTGSSLSDALLDQDTSRSVRWTVRGPIVADEDFRSYQITISPTTRIYTVYSGYLDQVVSSKTYDNNANAYEQFIFALDKANITKTRNDDHADIRGVCATDGIAYEFETLKDGGADHTIWSSTCSGSRGTMAANALQIHALFINQIPAFKPLFTATY